MFSIKNPCNKGKNCRSTSDALIFTFGMVLGGVATAAAFLMGDVKKKKCSLKTALKNCCDFDSNNIGDDLCDCEDGHCDYERARSGFDCHAEECDADILHSHGCLGYPHDDCGGFADSKGDRPNDTSNPEINRQQSLPDEKSSPYSAKNAFGKNNPQPENRVNEVKKKR